MILALFSFLGWSLFWLYCWVLLLGGAVEKWIIPSRQFKCILSKMYGMGAYFTGSRVRVIYDSGFDPRRQSLFCQNHVSKVDPLVAHLIVDQPLAVIMHEWLFKIPILGSVLRLQGGISLRKRRFNRRDQIEQMIRDRVSRGHSLLIFPEGTRSRTGEVDRYHEGAFIMAKNTDLPVVPVVVYGLHEISPADSWLFRPGRTITAYVGPQFETSHLSSQEVEELAQVIEQFARNTYERLRQENVYSGCLKVDS